jgi:hypothetical protein
MPEEDAIRSAIRSAEGWLARAKKLGVVTEKSDKGSPRRVDAKRLRALLAEAEVCIELVRLGVLFVCGYRLPRVLLAEALRVVLVAQVSHVQLRETAVRLAEAAVEDGGRVHAPAGAAAAGAAAPSAAAASFAHAIAPTTPAATPAAAPAARPAPAKEAANDDKAPLKVADGLRARAELSEVHPL